MRNMKPTSEKRFTTIANEKDNNNSNSDTVELFTKTEVENTPFVIITTEDGKTSFGTFGRYKITEDYHTPEQCKAELEKITWNRLIQIMSLIHTMLNNKNN